MIGGAENGSMRPRFWIKRLLAILIVTTPCVTLVARADVAPTPTQRDLAFVDAITWGANQSTMAAYRRLGKERWLQAQLHPPADERLPPGAREQIEALAVSHKSVFELATDFDAV